MKDDGVWGVDTEQDITQDVAQDAAQEAAPQAHQTDIDTGRRRFLTAGALLVSFTLLPRPRDAFGQTTTTEAGTFTATAPKLPGSLKTTPALDAWIRIDTAGKVTVCTGKAELGTGISTAFMQLGAEQLDLEPQAITLITADTGETPNEGYTAGSHSVADSGTAIFNAAAQVRILLLQTAAAQLQVDASTLTTQGGQIVAADGRRLSYGDAVRGTNLHRNAQPGVASKTPAQFHVVGHSLRRVDIPGKVTGGESYIQDMRPAGMVHARVVRPPAYGATLASVARVIRPGGKVLLAVFFSSSQRVESRDNHLAVFYEADRFEADLRASGFEARATGYSYTPGESFRPEQLEPRQYGERHNWYVLTRR